MDKCILTIATGKQLYVDMAATLARSYRVRNDATKVPFVIATDNLCHIPADVSQWVTVVKVDPAKHGHGFGTKLWIDQLSPAKRTLFVDADSLIVGNVSPMFERFAGRPVGVIGGSISGGEWFGDLGSMLRRFNLARMPKFNGGVYYLERGAIANSVFARARDLERRYDEIGLVRLRGLPNDEPLVALAMAMHGLESLPDDRTLLGDLYSCPELRRLSVFGGKATLRNPPSAHRRHCGWSPVGDAQPLIVHFLGGLTSDWRYQAEARKLKLAAGRNWPAIIAQLYVIATFSIWSRAKPALMNCARPAYRACFRRGIARTNAGESSIGPNVTLR